MTSSYFHPVSQGQLDRIVADLPQSLLISGKTGVGLTAAAKYLADKLSTDLQIVLPERDEKVDIDQGTITVESIRRLYDLTKTIETKRRIIAIDYAERMGTQAQNAFLKLLEEPGVNTHFILLSHEPSKLLPTILSRVQEITLKPITAEQSTQLLDELKVKDAQKRTQLLFMAAGLPAELTRLTLDESHFNNRAQIVRDAREFIQGSSYTRLMLAQRYKDNRTDTLQLLNDALKMLENAIKQGKSELIPVMKSLITSYERIEANGNIRLQLATAMV